MGRSSGRVSAAANVENSLWISLAIPKSSSLGTPFRAHQNVAGLDIAMHHQVLMRVLHRGAHVAK